MDADLTIARLAAGQHGALSRRQLLEAGVPGHVVDHRLACGLLVGVHAGVYRVAGSPVTWHQRIAAATFAAGPGAVASHRAAAFLHGLDGIGPAPEVTVGRARAPQPRGVIVHRLTALSEADVECRDGIRRTRPAATLMGLAAVLTALSLERALDDALMRGLISCAQLERRIETVGRSGRPGVAALSGLLVARGGARRWTQSDFERRLYALLKGAGLPLPMPQYEVRRPSGRRAFLDFAWPAALVALEANSYRHHGGRLAWSRDHVRNRAVIALGWRILPVTWEDLGDQPDELLSVLRLAGFSRPGLENPANLVP